MIGHMGVVLDVLFDPDYRKQWDSSLISIKSLYQISNTIMIGHMGVVLEHGRLRKLHLRPHLEHVYAGSCNWLDPDLGTFLVIL